MTDKNIFSELKKRISLSDIVVRFLLLIGWLPFGIIALAVSKKVKHKVCLALVYYPLFGTVGACILLYCVGIPIGMFEDGYSFEYTLALTNNALKSIMGNYTFSANGLEIKYIDLMIILFVIFLIVYLLVIINDRKKKIEKEQMKAYEETLSDKTIVDDSYQKAELLSAREKSFYNDIRAIAEKYNFSVLSKVRLADIVNVSEDVRKQSPDWWRMFEKISQKHIDFALADKADLDIKLLIEVDDLSHQRLDRIERDIFVDSVCEQSNIAILHLYDTLELEEKIIKILNIDNISEKNKLER